MLSHLGILRGARFSCLRIFGAFHGQLWLAGTLAGCCLRSRSIGVAHRGRGLAHATTNGSSRLYVFTTGTVRVVVNESREVKMMKLSLHGWVRGDSSLRCRSRSARFDCTVPEIDPASAVSAFGPFCRVASWCSARDAPIGRPCCAWGRDRF